MGSIRKHLTYANVVATIALLAAVSGGTAFAIKGKFGAKNLKNNAVTEAKIAPGAVTTPKIAGGAVVGASIADGQVGSAEVGDGAMQVADLAPATLQQLDAACPGSLSQFHGICVQGSNVTANTWLAAAQFCAANDLVLPDTGEAMLIGRNVVGGTELWTSDVTAGPGIAEAVVVTGNATPTATTEPAANNNTFRCVAPLTD
jgi:hypothetical protein